MGYGGIGKTLKENGPKKPKTTKARFIKQVSCTLNYYYIPPSLGYTVAFQLLHQGIKKTRDLPKTTPNHRVLQERHTRELAISRELHHTDAMLTGDSKHQDFKL
jgi:hypothetical protein